MTPAELKAIRKALGLTQVQFAARLGLSPLHGANYVSQLEGGRSRVTDRIARLAQAMHPAKS
jgi:transcriptional regulator with XRE-family HTH domain